MNKDDPNKYTLDYLTKEFDKHSKKFRKGCVERGQNVDFDLSMALHVICKEIQGLKNEK